MLELHPSRRQFIGSTAAMIASTPFSIAAASQSASDSLRGRIYKTLKIGMVQVPGSLTDKFKAAKEAGFDGIEMNSPGMDVDKTKQAIRESGLPVDGTVCSSHWSIHHTSPKATDRDQALEHLRIAIRDTHAVGGQTVLLVVGHGQDGPEDQIWARSLENIAKALPLAAKLGIHIALENVWNHFLYDHRGGSDQSAEKFVKYVDEFNSPWVGMQFDIGNHWKYGNTGDWIRALGKRIIKLDAKGFSRKTDKFTKIGAGDLDWADVRKSLVEINFIGWCAAEVEGGDLTRLHEVSSNIDSVFELS